MNGRETQGVLVLEGASSKDFETVGRLLAEELQDGDVVLLDGELGAGKTSLVQAVGRGLGVVEEIVSPTFNILSVYDSGRIQVNHFDLYRLEDESQLDDVDFWALVDEGSPGAALIEWADLFPAAMPEDALTVRLAYSHESAATRDVFLEARGKRGLLVLASMKEALLPS